MPRLVTLAVAMALCWVTLELRPVNAAPAIATPRKAAPTLDLGGGVPRTARALRAAITEHGLDGRVWLGTLRAVGGGRDTLVYVPRGLDPARTIELIVYMEGHGSFADHAMEHRHAASIARLRGNHVYVAPDAPSSTHGDRKARTAYWQHGCAERRCAGGHAAPGDFIAFLGEARARIAAMTRAEAGALDLRLSLIGFSNGGKGVFNAVTQLAAADFTAGGHPVRLADVIFADGNYGDAWLAATWLALAARPESPRLTILVGNGPFAGTGPDGGNRRRAAAFWRAAAPAAPPPAAGRATATPRLRLIPMRAGHHAIGDAAVDYLADPAAGALALTSP